MHSTIDELVVDLAKEERPSSVTPPSVLLKQGAVFLVLGSGLAWAGGAGRNSWFFLFSALAFSSCGTLFGFPSKERAAKWALIAASISLALGILLSVPFTNRTGAGAIPAELAMLVIAGLAQWVLLAFLARLAPLPVDLAVGISAAVGGSLALTFGGMSWGPAGCLVAGSLLSWPLFRAVYRALQGRFLSSQSILWRTARNAGPSRSAPLLSEPMKDVLGNEVRPQDLAGKKLWIILYRYAGCPMCSAHLADLKAWLKKHCPTNLSVMLVYESPPERLQVIATQLAGLPVRVFADPENHLYSRLGSRLSVSGMFKPGAVVAFLRALARGFFQGKIDGDLRRHPAHLFADSEGIHSRRYVGSHIADHIPWPEVSRFALR
jgi:peroxiredoxin